MKIAIGVKNKQNKEINEMFSRSPFFILLEIEDSKIISEEFHENSFVNQTSGAGVSVVEQLAKKNIDCIVCFTIGPRAYDLCKQLNIRVYKTEKSNFEETKDMFIKNELKEIK